MTQAHEPPLSMATPLDLSVCMIARNEEALIGEAVASVRGFAGEILVGDTGSTDRTREVAAAAGATVLDVPWTGDFAAARNAVLAQARGRWILFFDADERAADTVGPWLQRHLTDLPPGGYLGVFRSPVLRAAFRRLCLFANSHGITWHRALHEIPVWPDGRPVEGPLVADLLFWDVSHRRDPEQVRARREAYITRLRGELDDGPTAPFIRRHLASALEAVGRHREAYDALLPCWENPAWRHHFPPGDLPHFLATFAWNEGDWQRTERWARLALADEPGHLFSRELLVRAKATVHGLAAVGPEAEAWLHASRSDSPCARHQLILAPQAREDAWRYLVWSLLASGDEGRARQVAASSGAPPDLRVHIGLWTNRHDEAITLYDRAGGGAGPAFWQGLLASGDHGRDLVAAMLWGSLRHPYYAELAEQRFAAAIARSPDEPEPYQRRAEWRWRAFGEAAAALADLREVVRLAPDRLQAWRLMAELERRQGNDEAARQAGETVARLQAATNEASGNA